jgi:hypothetical protein
VEAVFALPESVDASDVTPTISETEPVITDPVITDPVLRLVTQLAKQVETQGAVLRNICERVDTLLEKNNSANANVVSYSKGR